jgi:hypothetical protein
MTSEERERMNSLCLGIQEEKDYNRFAAMLHEMSELIARKEQRRFQQFPRVTWQRNKPWKTVSAVVQKTVRPLLANQPEKVQIAIAAADDLFREVRIENDFMDVDGASVPLTTGAKLTITFEAEPTETPRPATS